MRLWMMMFCAALCACDDGDDDPFINMGDCGCVGDMYTEPDLPIVPAPCDNQVRIDLADEPNGATVLQVMSTEWGGSNDEPPESPLCAEHTDVLHFTAPEDGPYLFRARGEGALAMGVRTNCNTPATDCTTNREIRHPMTAGEVAEIRIRAYDDFDADEHEWSGPLWVQAIRDVVPTVDSATVRVWSTGFVATLLGTSADRDEELIGTFHFLDAAGNEVEEYGQYAQATYIDDHFRSILGGPLQNGAQITHYRLIIEGSDVALEGEVERVDRPGAGEPCYYHAATEDTACADGLSCGANASECPADNPGCVHDRLCGRDMDCSGGPSEPFPEGVETVEGALPQEPTGLPVSCGAGFGQMFHFDAPRTATYTFQLRTEGWTGVLAVLTCDWPGIEVSCSDAYSIHLVEGSQIRLRVDAAPGEVPGAYAIDVSEADW